MSEYLSQPELQIARNPYIVGRSVRGSEFYGRQKLIQHLLTGAEDNFWIVGTRRMGKTSLLRNLQRTISPMWVAVYFNLEGTGTYAELSEEFNHEIYQNARLVSVICESNSLLHQYDFLSALARIDRVLTSSGQRLLLLVDEGDALHEILDKELALRLRRVLQQSNNLRVIIASSPRLLRLSGENLRLLQSFARISLPVLQQEETINLIQQTQSSNPVRVSSETLQAILNVTGCHPYLAQLLCWRLYDPGNNQLKQPSARDFVVDDVVGSIFRDNLSFLSGTQLKALLMLARDNEFTYDEIAKQVLSPASLEFLLDLGYLRRSGDILSLGSTFLDLWLRESREELLSSVSGPSQSVASVVNAQADIESRLPKSQSTGTLSPSWPTWMDDVINRSENKPRLDVGIVIALEEEFRELAPHIRKRPYYNPDIKQYYYLFEYQPTNATIPGYRCVVTFMGKMGPTEAGLVADRLIAQFAPTTVVSIGIAGSMDKSVFVGDVVVADQSDEYLASGKAIESIDKQDWDIQFSGDPYRSDPAHIAHALNLPYAHESESQGWRIKNNRKLVEWIGTVIVQDLREQHLIRETPEIHTGPIASGPVVGAAKQFVTWLKEKRNRKYLALEMESVAVLNAAHRRGASSLIVRGVSDYSDERKQRLDSIERGALRRYAMHNALALLWVFMDLQLLKHA